MLFCILVIGLELRYIYVWSSCANKLLQGDISGEIYTSREELEKYVITPVYPGVVLNFRGLDA